MRQAFITGTPTCCACFEGGDLAGKVCCQHGQHRVFTEKYDMARTKLLQHPDKTYGPYVAAFDAHAKKLAESATEDFYERINDGGPEADYNLHQLSLYDVYKACG